MIQDREQVLFRVAICWNIGSCAIDNAAVQGRRQCSLLYSPYYNNKDLERLKYYVVETSG